MLCGTSASLVIVINIIINQLEAKVSLIKNFCVRLVVVYKHEMLEGQR